MITKIIFCLFVIGQINGRMFKFGNKNSGNFGCYWNNQCSMQLFGSKTPYDAVRGDLRDYERQPGCEPVSLWSLHRHGNRNPGTDVTERMKHIAGLRPQIVAAYDAGTSHLCAQDIDAFRKFVWNETLDVSPSFLTGVGYEELYDIGTRVRLAYPELLDGSADEYYFRPTNEQRTITSAIAFAHGLTDGTNLTLPVDDIREVENVLRPYKHCDRYQELVKEASLINEELEAFENTPEYQAIRDAVQQRLGISYQVTTGDVYSFYENCRFHRSWEPTLRSPWCAVFTDEELLVLDYRDDVRHYYRNGYGSWVNERLGGPPLKDLYENFEAAVQGVGKRVVSYFTHDTMMEMVWCALGLYKDPEPLRGAQRNENRLWRSSYIAVKSINFMAVLNSCQQSDDQVYRVQVFIGEKPTELCPVEGCTWEQFQDIFQPFTSANLDFCSLSYQEPIVDSVPDSAIAHGLSINLLILSIVVVFTFL